jgi:hypothetical protein
MRNLKCTFFGTDDDSDDAAFHARHGKRARTGDIDTSSNGTMDPESGNESEVGSLSFQFFHLFLTAMLELDVMDLAAWQR